jgi:exopolyphosphatase / guanosine-5'-triphosphate,3'-diphosphate pyrophosphatase
VTDERANGASGPQSPVPARHRRRRTSAFDRGSRRAGGHSSRLHYAALDLGTNNCRLLVAHPTAEAFQVVDSFSRIVRLGEGLSGSGRLSDAAMVRAIGALKICAGKLSQHGHVRSRLIATEACRAALNGAIFLAACVPRPDCNWRSSTGKPRRGSPHMAALRCSIPGADGAILFDIGGGSSELAFLGRCTAADGGPPIATVQAWASLPMGVVTMAERHGGKSVTRQIFDAMIDEVLPFIDDFAKRAGVNGTGGLHLARHVRYGYHHGRIASRTTLL